MHWYPERLSLFTRAEKLNEKLQNGSLPAKSSPQICFDWLAWRFKDSLISGQHLQTKTFYLSVQTAGSLKQVKALIGLGHVPFWENQQELHCSALSVFRSLSNLLFLNINPTALFCLAPYRHVRFSFKGDTLNMVERNWFERNNKQNLCDSQVMVGIDGEDRNFGNMGKIESKNKLNVLFLTGVNS